MLRLQGRLLAFLVLVSIRHVSSRETCKSPKRFLDHNLECVKCPPEPDCPEDFFKRRRCGFGFQTECLPCLNCTSVYRTVSTPCTPTSQTTCGECKAGFFEYMGICVHETTWETTTFSHMWRNESSVVMTSAASPVTPTHPELATHRPTQEVPVAQITTLPLPIFIGVSALTAALLLFGVGFASFRLRKARNADRSGTTCTVSDCERSVRADAGINGRERSVRADAGINGREDRASLTDELSTDIIPSFGSTDSGCDVSWSHQENSPWDGSNPPLVDLSPTEIVQSPLHFSYPMEGTVNVSGHSEGVSGMFNKSKLWVDVAQARLGVDGGCLGLPALGAYLCIDSVERNTDIELAVLNSPKHLPALAKGESLVSPVISCSPHGASFQKPALLSFPHCGDLTSTDVTLLVSETSLDEAPKWREASLDGSCGVSYMVKGSECLLYTSHFTLFGLKAKAKQVKIMIFSKLLPEDRFFEIHIFCVNDTPESVSVVKDQERKNGFSLTCPPKEITFLSNDKDVKVKMSLNSLGWEMLTQHKQVIGYTSVQQNSNPQGQYVTFHLRAVSENTCASVHVVASQKSNSSVAEFDFPLSLVSSEQDDTSCPCKSSPNMSGCVQTPGAFPPAIERFLSEEQSPSPASFLYCLTGGNSAFQPKAIPQDLQEKLMLGLDVKVETGNDFRWFAYELGFDSSQRTLFDQRFDSPTHCLLTYMELCGMKRRQTSSEILQELAQILTKIERSDLATLVEDQLKQRPLSIASNSTDSGLGPPSPSTGSQLSVATSASDMASTPGKPQLVDEVLERSGLLEGNHQNATENPKQDSRNKVETEV